MKRSILPLVALLGFLVNGECLRAADAGNAPEPVSTATSDTYSQVSCTCSNALASADTLQLAADTRQQLSPLLGLKPTWRFPVHIHIVTPDDPLADKVQEAVVQVIATDKTMSIEALVPSSDPDAREFIQRQFVTALLWEKFFKANQTFDTHTRLDVVPVWLVEGLREWLNEDPEHNRESIVRKAVQSKLAPSLVEVTNWKDLSSDRLLGLWQRAFCYYLVDSLIQPGPRRDNFQQWLSTFSGSNPTSPQFLFPTEMGWQRELVDATHRSRELVYSWDETVAELAAAETIAIPSDKASNTRICTLYTVCNFPRDKKLIEAVQQKILDLTSLELRAHPSWRPILELYRSGLTALVDDKNQDKAKKLIAQANEQWIAEMAYHQKLVDYMNWFEVTKDYAGNTSRFRTYFWTAQQMERVEADPNHPNPIRANLLQVESQL